MRDGFLGGTRVPGRWEGPQGVARGDTEVKISGGESGWRGPVLPGHQGFIHAEASEGRSVELWGQKTDSKGSGGG